MGGKPPLKGVKGPRILKRPKLKKLRTDSQIGLLWASDSEPRLAGKWEHAIQGSGIVRLRDHVHDNLS